MTSIRRTLTNDVTTITEIVTVFLLQVLNSVFSHFSILCMKHKSFAIFNQYFLSSNHLEEYLPGCHFTL